MFWRQVVVVVSAGAVRILGGIRGRMLLGKAREDGAAHVFACRFAVLVVHDDEGHAVDGIRGDLCERLEVGGEPWREMAGGGVVHRKLTVGDFLDLSGLELDGMRSLEVLDGVDDGLEAGLAADAAGPLAFEDGERGVAEGARLHPLSLDQVRPACSHLFGVGDGG